MIKKFIAVNIKISNAIETLFSFEKNDSQLLVEFFDKFNQKSKVADVGGGKKPAKISVGKEVVEVAVYDGFDVDLNELKIAEDYYTNIFELDLTQSLPRSLNRKYSHIVCLNTLEHVQDVEKSIKNLASMLSEDGELYLKLPCRHAVFAKLNLILPQAFKKKLLHYVYPEKSGDGFRAYYDKSTPKEYIKLLENNGLKVQNLRLVKWSSYFSFFVPLYLIWRVITLVQDKAMNDYCESFEIEVKKLTN